VCTARRFGMLSTPARSCYARAYPLRSIDVGMEPHNLPLVSGQLSHMVSIYGAQLAAGGSSPPLSTGSSPPMSPRALEDVAVYAGSYVSNTRTPRHNLLPAATIQVLAEAACLPASSSSHRLTRATPPTSSKTCYQAAMRPFRRQPMARHSSWRCD
jgi:hypothetical protein